MFKKAINAIRLKTAALSAILFGLSVSAYAALPPVVGSTVASVEQDGKDMFDLTFPAIATLVGLVIVVKLFKRFMGKI